MVFKSAYQRSFRGPKWDNFTVDEFQKRLQYRTDRRSVEHQHQAWLWDSESEEDVEDIPMPADNKQDDNRVENLPNRPNDIERRRSVRAWVDEQKEMTGGERKIIPDEEMAEHKADERREPRKRNNIDEVEQHQQDTRRHRQHKHRSHPRKPQANDKDREPESPILHHLEEKKKHPPFLPYGWANNAPTEQRKTHNVLASDPEVYPAALRAAKRRQNIIKQKVKLHEEAIKKRELTPPVEANPLFSKDMWLTEYQRNFCKADDLKRHYGR